MMFDLVTFNHPHFVHFHFHFHFLLEIKINRLAGDELFYFFKKNRTVLLKKKINKYTWTVHIFDYFI
jgi:hypothetical protein